jgi:hypothetical protein
MAQYELMFAVIPVVHYNVAEPKCQGELVQTPPSISSQQEI